MRLTRLLPLFKGKLLNAVRHYDGGADQPSLIAVGHPPTAAIFTRSKKAAAAVMAEAGAAITYDAGEIEKDYIVRGIHADVAALFKPDAGTCAVTISKAALQAVLDAIDDDAVTVLMGSAPIRMEHPRVVGGYSSLDYLYRIIAFTDAKANSAVAFTSVPVKVPALTPTMFGEPVNERPTYTQPQSKNAPEPPCQAPPPPDSSSAAPDKTRMDLLRAALRKKQP